MEFIFKWKLKHEKRTNIMTKIKKKNLLDWLNSRVKMIQEKIVELVVRIYLIWTTERK